MLSRNCKTVKDCTKMSSGWTRGFVRCDYCKCLCEDSRDVVPEVVEVTSTKQFEEETLYGTCTGTCYKSGLVRTNIGGCKEVRNCVEAKHGWLSGLSLYYYFIL